MWSLIGVINAQCNDGSQFLTGFGTAFFRSPPEILAATASLLAFFAKTFRALTEVVFFFHVCKALAQQAFGAVLAGCDAFLAHHGRISDLGVFFLRHVD